MQFMIINSSQSSVLALTEGSYTYTCFYVLHHKHHCSLLLHSSFPCLHPSHHTPLSNFSSSLHRPSIICST
ncbi:hypothetical protein VIGAN_11230900 [Vigna angularis var. angularis]|uniref:Uncharacterized protein n=1 Tax=Vigna angularis var. angularis TaxID=157739 RepID=A0A0S3TCS7_PHAAN|nr:hypothetical protein VIGAN_11230900 [Vigna angularis var. angularis]